MSLTSEKCPLSVARDLSGFGLISRSRREGGKVGIAERFPRRRSRRLFHAPSGRRFPRWMSLPAAV